MTSDARPMPPSRHTARRAADRGEVIPARMFRDERNFSNYAYPESREDRGHRRARNLADERMAREAWYLNERKFTDAIAGLVVR